MDSFETCQAFFENVTDPVFLRDGDKRILYMNPVAERLTGWSLQEARGRKCYEVFHDAIRPCNEACPVDGAISQGTGLPDFGRTIRTRSGTVHRLQGWVSTIPRQGAMVILRNVTESDERPDEAAETEELLRNVLSDTPLAISYLREGKLLWANKAMMKLFGHREEEDYLHKHPREFYASDEEFERAREMLLKAVKHGESVETEARFKRSDGTVFFGRIKASALEGTTIKSGTIATISDITEQRLIEEALRQSEQFNSALVKNAPLGIAYLDKNGIIKYSNPASNRIAGVPEGQETPALGRSIFELPGLRDQKEVLNQLRLLLEGVPFSELELPYRSLSGVEVMLAVWGMPRLGTDGSVVGAVLMFLDVTERKRADEILRESEERYRTAVEESFDGIFLQRGTKITYANARLHEMLGYYPGELEGMDHWLIYHPDYQELTRSRAQARLRGEEAPARYEVELLRRDGSQFAGELLAKVITVGGEPGIQVWIRDISQRKAAEEALRRSEEKYRTVFDNASVGIDLIDREGRLVETNAAFQEMLGYTGSELEGRSIYELTHPEDHSLSRKELEALIRRETDSYRVEKRYIRKDGTVMWADLSVSTIISKEGEYEATLGVITDITERKRAEEDRRRLAAAVEQSAEAILITSRDGTIQYVNPAFEAITGYSAEEAVGRTPRILKSGKQDSAFYRNLWQTISRGEVWRGRLTNRKKDGTLYEEDASISPIKNEQGVIINYVATKRDVTTETMLERQLREAQKMEAIATLAGGIAHDFNNLLTIVLGYAELLLLGKKEGSAGYEELQSMLHAAKRGGDLVRRILTFSKKVETNLRPVDMNQEILECQKLLSSIIPKMIKIDLILGENLWKVNADPGQMEQILLNLAVNAHQAMPEGGTLTIATSNVTLDSEYCRSRLDAEPGDYVLLSVADTGQGMGQDVLEHIFEPFFTTKRPGEGTGLGLSMVHGIVERHGGFVRCYSEPGEGTVFKIYLPALVTETEISVADSGITPAFGTETVLLVDDEELILNLGKRILKRYGYTVLTARNGKEAIKVFRDAGNLISLVILDLIMPEMGGRQCMEALLKIDPKVKVLIASGFGMDGPINEAVERGARGFVSKPFNMKELLQTVRRILDEP